MIQFSEMHGTGRVIYDRNTLNVEEKRSYEMYPFISILSSILQGIAGEYKKGIEI